MSYYCEGCKRRVGRKTKTGTGFWVFVILLWLPSLALSVLAVIGVITYAGPTTINDAGPILLLLGIWILLPFIIYYRRVDMCPICNAEVKKYHES